MPEIHKTAKQPTLHEIRGTLVFEAKKILVKCQYVTPMGTLDTRGVGQIWDFLQVNSLYL